MKDTVEYRGFSIAVHSGMTEAGKCWGKYKVTPATDEATKAMDRHAISEFGSEHIHETSDLRASNPGMLNVPHLIEMGQRQIDDLLSRDKE